MSNRDEFFCRPTQRATIRDLPDGTKILSPLDLGRDEHGTWIGITSTGKIAVLVNYREEGDVFSKVSRGIIPIEYLSSSDEDEEWHDLIQSSLKRGINGMGPVKLQDIGGFSFVYGKLQIDENTGNIKPLNIISNRGDRGKIHSYNQMNDLHEDVARQQTFSLSNALYYHPWKKTVMATEALGELVETARADRYSHDQLVESCFDVLSKDTYNPIVREGPEGLRDEKLAELRNLIFIPPLEVNCLTPSVSGKSIYNRFYGTRTQTVIMLHKSGNLHYYERDLHSDDSEAVKVQDQHFQFKI